MTPRLALLIPSFNNEDTIEETLASILEQEVGLNRLSAVFLADDGSVDETTSVARSTWRSEIPLRVLSHARNRGQWPNVNDAFSRLAPEFDWVLILHADDVAEPSWLSATAARMDACDENVGAICCGMKILERSGRLRSGEPPRDVAVELIPGDTRSVRMTIKGGGWWHISGSAIRVDAFSDVGTFRQDLDVADWEWSLRLLAKGWSVEFISDLLIIHRHRDESVAALSFAGNRDLMEQLRVVEEWAAHLSNGERRSLYLQNASFALRRVGRAILARSTRKLVISLASLARASGYYMRTFTRREIYRSSTTRQKDLAEPSPFPDDVADRVQNSSE